MTTVKANTENRDVVVTTKRKVITSVTIDLSLEDAIKLKALIGDTSDVLTELHKELCNIVGLGPYNLMKILPTGVIVLARNSAALIKEKLEEIEANLNF